METTSTDAPSILLIHNPQIPEQYLAELQKDLAGLTHNVRTQKGEPGIQGAPEWVLPAAIALLIGKGLLDGFLREFGADTARALKKTVGKVLKRVKAKPIKWFSVAGKPTGVSPLLSVEFVLESSERSEEHTSELQSLAYL